MTNPISPKNEEIMKSQPSVNMSTQLQQFENICISVTDKEIINSKNYNVLKIID